MLGVLFYRSMERGKKAEMTVYLQLSWPNCFFFLAGSVSKIPCCKVLNPRNGFQTKKI